MILQRYILRELLLSWFFAFATLTSVCLIGMIFQIFRTFEGVGLEVLAETFPMAVGYIAPWALLVATCTASTLVYGRMAAENEVDAMRMSGIHMNRILAPAILFGILLGGTNYVLNDYVAPWAHWTKRVMSTRALHLALKVPPPGAQQFRIGDHTLTYADFRDGRMERPYLVQIGAEAGKESRPVQEFHALRGYILDEGTRLVLVMSNPTVTAYSKDGVRQSMAEGDVRIPLPTVDAAQGAIGPEDMSWVEILEYLRRPLSKSRRNKAWTILYTRFAHGAVPICLILVSVPIGIFVKRGARLAGLGAALPPLLVYFVLFFTFQGLGEKGSATPTLAAFLPPAILAALAALLLSNVFRK